MKLRDAQIHLRLSRKEKEMIQERMKFCQMDSISAYIRRMSIDGCIVVVDHSDIKCYNYELNRIGNNINQIAHQEFAMTASRGTGRGSVLAFHLIQSFKPGETDHETAHKIGQEFASLVTGDRYEYVVATHMDKDHIHNHICINHALMLYEGMKRYRPNMKTAISKVSQYDMKKPMHQFLKVHRFFNHIFSFYHLSFMYFSGSANKNKL